MTLLLLRKTGIANIAVSLALSLVAVGSVSAQQTTKDGSAIPASDPVVVFHQACYSQVPNVESIEETASRVGWKPIKGADLGNFTTIEYPDVLLGWDVLVSKRLYRMGVVQSDLTPAMLEKFPDFSTGKATTCTLILDGQDQGKDIINNMTALAQRDPISVNVAEGDLATTTWAGGNEKFKVFLFAKTDLTDKAVLLSVTILAKE